MLALLPFLSQAWLSARLEIWLTVLLLPFCRLDVYLAGLSTGRMHAVDASYRHRCSAYVLARECCELRVQLYIAAASLPWLDWWFMACRIGSGSCLECLFNASDKGHIKLAARHLGFLRPIQQSPSIRSEPYHIQYLYIVIRPCQSQVEHGRYT